ncbi:heterokaryon incompatibility protein-domain-containing protein [Xylaria cubensis]|nr:heterokaryon incompatibility protein-domain-containing protein [Xylaria cubensis]
MHQSERRASLTLSEKERRRRKIENFLLFKQSRVLRHRSLPKCINPKTDEEEDPVETQSLNDLCVDGRSASPSQDCSETRWVYNPHPKGFCKACQDINIERLADNGGYNHIYLYELAQSKSTCRMCSLIDGTIGDWMKDYTPDRYRIRLSLRIKEGDAARWSQHHNDPDWHWADGLSTMWVEAMDLRPWEPPEYYKSRHLCKTRSHPEDFLEPQGSPPKSVRGKPIHCFTEEHDPARQLGIRWVREIGQDTASDSSYDVAAEWLEQCLSSEPAPSYERFMPRNSGWSLSTRRISSAVTARLIDTEEQDYHFAALSYCWGEHDTEQERRWQLTEANKFAHYREIDVDSLPSTVRDGILIAARLKLAYIWIDALCIIQDSTLDWAREAAKMGGIYFGSVVTITASASTSAYQGAFNSQSQRTCDADKFDDLVTIEGCLRDGRRSRLYILPYGSDAPDVYDDEVIKAPLSKRAWTYQEFALPQRTLYCTSKQLFWECTHCRLSEDNFPQAPRQRPYPIPEFEYTLEPERIAEYWYIGAVQEYSRRQMTFGKDKLVAISALARATYHNRPADYIAGLWRDSLLSGLKWIRDGQGSKSKSMAYPSCSNGSFSDSVEDRIPDALPRIAGVNWEPDPVNPFGDVRSAYIDFHTKVGAGVVLRDYFNNDHMFYGWGNNQALMIPYVRNNGVADWLFAEAIMDSSGLPGGPVTVALLQELFSSTHIFFLLEKLHVNANEYKRVGIGILQSKHISLSEMENSEYAKGWAEETIRLV